MSKVDENQLSTTEPQSAGRLFVESIGKVNIAADGGIALVGGYVLSVFLPTTTLALWKVVVAGILIAGLLLALLVAFFRSHGQTKRLWNELNRQRAEFDRTKPSRIVKSVVPHYFPYPACSCILIVSWTGTAVLAVNTGVSVSIATETHELPLGFGTVRHIQEDGCGVITLDAPHNTALEQVKKILITPELLSKLRIGVQVSLQHLEAARTPVMTSTEGKV